MDALRAAYAEEDEEGETHAQHGPRGSAEGQHGRAAPQPSHVNVAPLPPTPPPAAMDQYRFLHPQAYGGPYYPEPPRGHPPAAGAGPGSHGYGGRSVPAEMARKRNLVSMMETEKPTTTVPASMLRPYVSKRRREGAAQHDGAAAEVVPHPDWIRSSAAESTGHPPASAAVNASSSSMPTSEEPPGGVRLVEPRLPSVLFNRMRKPDKTAATTTKLVQRVTRRFAGVHTGTVNTCRWSSNQGVFLATASMDKTVKIWDAFAAVGRAPGCVATLSGHNEAVMDVRWNADNTRILSGSLDKTVLLTDLETRATIHSFKHKEMITTVTWHPHQPDVFLAGGFSRGIVCWDARSNSVVAQYKGLFGSVQAIEWIHNGNSFVSSSDITKRNSVDKAILVWDFNAAAVISNQVYQELFTCPYLKTHPSGSHFIVQSNANYIATFSTKSPFKQKKDKLFAGHRVDGCHIGCDISPDGSLVATGSADGSVHFYAWHSGRPIKSIRGVHENDQACSHVTFHPLHPQVMASCGWDGAVVLLGAKND